MKKRTTQLGAFVSSVGKAVRLPHHGLSKRLQATLDLVDSLHSPKNLKAIAVHMNPSINGGSFIVYAATGPYAIEIDPLGSHPELTLLHETAHFLEWQAIPKPTPGDRDFVNDWRFDIWLQAVRVSPNYRRIIRLRDQQGPASQAYADLNYLLRPAELWARAYAQYIARQGEGKAAAAVLFQQIAAENKRGQGRMIYQPYWPWNEFPPIQDAMGQVFQELEWDR